MRDTAFGIQVAETDPEALLREQAAREEAAKREAMEWSWHLARRFGNRQQRRHPFAGFPGTRASLTPAERARRAARRRMARASRKANR